MGCSNNSLDPAVLDLRLCNAGNQTLVLAALDPQLYNAGNSIQNPDLELQLGYL